LTVFKEHVMSKDKNKGISRRTFLRTSALTGAVTMTAGAGVFTASAAPGIRAGVAALTDVSEWHREADIVVVGSGTGQIVGIQAAKEGLSTIVLEKSSQTGGTTGISGGGIWIPNNYKMAEEGIPDSREEALEYLEHATFGQGDPDLFEPFVDNCNAAVETLREVGIEWYVMEQFNDYYVEFPGGKPRGRSISPISTIEGASGGGALVRMMRAAAEELGVEYLVETPAKRLVVDADGAVIGVIAESEGQDVNIRARRGVVIATGGFDHNEEMVKHFIRGPIYYPSAVRGSTGDGHLMGMALGANLRNMNENWGWPVYYNEEFNISIPALAIELGRPGSIVVNRSGKRFFNEAASYDLVTRAFYMFDSATLDYINIPGYAIVDSDHRSRYTFAYMPPGMEMPDWVARGDTIEELAEQLEIDPEALAATVTRFNEYADQGVDPDFKRGEFDFDVRTGGDPTRDDLANPCLAPLGTPPFYAAPIWPGSLGTCGGLQINENAEVLNVWGEPIPRLYAVGNASGSVMGAGYPGGGATVGAGFTFGYLAALHMAGLDSL
jgi:3-oxosteroid 1-dehydrogenase